MKQFSKLEWLLHLAFWAIIYAAIFSLSSQIFDWKMAMVLSGKNILSWCTIAYLNIYFLIPVLFVPKRFAWYFISAIALVFLVYFLAEQIQVLFWGDFIPSFPNRVGLSETQMRQFGPKPMIPLRFVAQFLMATAILFVSSLYQLAKTFIEKERQSAQLEKEKIQHELNFLRSQINPHFLFNALNNLYATVQLKPEQSGAYILKLSEMLRYVLEECKKEKVQLQDEIAYIKNYIFFQKQKDDQLVNIDFKVKGPVDRHQLEPMLFIALVENAFHHSQTTSAARQWININLHIDNNQITFCVKNSLGDLNKNPNQESLGIGLKNIKRRLELKYHKAHQLITKQSSNYFTAQLRINL